MLIQLSNIKSTKSVLYVNSPKPTPFILHSWRTQWKTPQRHLHLHPRHIPQSLRLGDRPDPPDGFCLRRVERCDRGGVPAGGGARGEAGGGGRQVGADEELCRGVRTRQPRPHDAGEEQEVVPVLSRRF